MKGAVIIDFTAILDGNENMQAFDESYFHTSDYFIEDKDIIGTRLMKFRDASPKSRNWLTKTK